MQGCTNPRHQVTVVTTFGTVFCNICGFAVMELAFYHPFCTWNFEVASGFLENWCTLVFICTCVCAYRYLINMTACRGQVFNPLASCIIWQVWGFGVTLESSCAN